MPEAVAARLRANAEQLLNEVVGMPEELIGWVPGEGVWTVMDNLCHVREFVPFWTAEALRVVAGSAEPWGRNHADADRLAAVTGTSRHRLEDVVRDIREAVEASAAALSRLSDAELAAEAPSRNPRWGVKPAWFIVDDLLVGHIEKHLGQIRRNAAQFAEAR